MVKLEREIRQNNNTRLQRQADSKANNNIFFNEALASNRAVVTIS